MKRVFIIILMAHLVWNVVIAVRGTHRPAPTPDIILDDGAPIKAWTPDYLPWDQL